MLTESLKTSQDSEYIHVAFCTWESIYECIESNGLLNIPISILFHYNKSVVNEVVVAVSPVNSNTPIGILLEGYNMQNVNLQDNNNDGLEDNNENNQKMIIDEKNEEYYIIKPHFPLINVIIDDIIFDSISDTKHLNQLINELVNHNSIFKGLFFEETIHYMFQKKRKPFNNITIDNKYL